MKADFKTSRVKNSTKRRKKPPERARKRSDTYKRSARREFEKSKSSKMISPYRRGSTTSQESQLGVQILSALSIGAASNATPLQVPNMKRRAGLDEGTLALKDAERLLPFLFSRQSDSDEDLSSEEKPNDVMDKDMDLEAGNECKNNQDSENEDSQPEEETKMLDPVDANERSKSKTSNKSFKRNSDRRVSAECQTKYMLQDEKNEHENSERKPTKGDLGANLSSYCPDLTRLMQLEGQTNAREIATQTLPIEMLEMEALKQSIDEIINSRNCSSKGTQISPQMKKSKKQPK